MDKVVFGKHELPTLVAITEDEQVQGLMYKSWPPPIMSFPFKQSKVRKFWMRNTISPLDIIFCRGNKVISIISGEPLSLKQVGPDEPCDLVVELPKGTAENIGITAGSIVKLQLSTNTLAKKYASFLSQMK